MLHQFAAPCALGAGLVLVAVAPTFRAASAAALYAGSLLVLFTVSATYHRVNWSPAARKWMRRADHAAIFVLIAGTYTPIALVGLPPGVGTPMFVLVWAGAFLGSLQSLFWVQAPKWVTAVLAVAVGWTVVPWFSEVRAGLSITSLALILAGGVAYTMGAVVYALKRPDLRPGVFGYHEVFHALTLVGAALHFTAVLGLVRAASA